MNPKAVWSRDALVPLEFSGHRIDEKALIQSPISILNLHVSHPTPHLDIGYSI